MLQKHLIHFGLTKALRWHEKVLATGVGCGYRNYALGELKVPGGSLMKHHDFTQHQIGSVQKKILSMFFMEPFSHRNSVML